MDLESSESKPSKSFMERERAFANEQDNLNPSYDKKCKESPVGSMRQIPLSCLDPFLSLEKMAGGVKKKFSNELNQEDATSYSKRM